MNLAKRTEELLCRQSHTLLEEKTGLGEFVWPRYDGYSLANVPATLFTFLDCDARDLEPPLADEIWRGLEGGVQRVVLVLLDAVGFLRLRAQIESGALPFLRRAAQQGRFAPLTSVFPATTNAALTTLHTGRTPGAHGMLAYSLYLREFGTVAEMIRLRPFYGLGDLARWGLDPQTFVPVPGIGRLLGEQGVLAAHFINGSFLNTPLSRIFYRDYHALHPVSSATDMFVRMRQYLEAHPGEKVLLSSYWGSVDSIAHLRGPTHASWSAEVETLIWALENHFWRPLPSSLRAETILVLLADHGQVTVDATQALIVEEELLLNRALLLPPTGEARAAFLYPRAGRTEEVEGLMLNAFGDRFALLKSSEALDAGLFGSPPWHPETPYRVGDYLALARGRAFIERSRHERAMRLVGRHGGLSPAEMLVPFLAVRLDVL
jgi:predicted AlkP superfamily pyrophosphatase or phosphodiesterase